MEGGGFLVDADEKFSGFPLGLEQPKQQEGPREAGSRSQRDSYRPVCEDGQSREPVLRMKKRKMSEPAVFRAPADEPGQTGQRCDSQGDSHHQRAESKLGQEQPLARRDISEPTEFSEHRFLTVPCRLIVGSGRPRHDEADFLQPQIRRGVF